MPTELLPLRVEHFLLRACPSAVLATHDIVAEAVRRNLRDEDVISQLVKEYNCDRLGFPVGAMPSGTETGSEESHADALISRRRRMLINFYLVNTILPIDFKRIDVLCDDRNVSDGVLLAGLRGKYGVTEIGYPYPKVEEETDANVQTSGAAGTVHDSAQENSAKTLASSSPTVSPYPPTKASAHALSKKAESIALKHEVTMLFLRAAPERLAEAKGICDSFEVLGDVTSRDEVLASVRRSLGNCASDGWSLDPDKRRLARLQRFFLNNDPPRLYDRPAEVTALVNSNSSEHALFLELQYAYGKDELGREVSMDHYAFSEVSQLLSRCRPIAATTDFICTYLALGERRGWSADRLLLFLREQFDCDSEGWPQEIRQRIRAKTIRYLMVNAPEDVGRADEILSELIFGTRVDWQRTRDKIKGSGGGGLAGAGGALNEALIMTRLYERYGRDERGRPVLNTSATRFRVCQFLEEYVPESEVERLADEALGLNMYPDTLMRYLEDTYRSFTPYPYELRWRLRTMYMRAAPEKIHQVDHVLRVKRIEKIPDSVLTKTVMKKLNCGPDGWPVDPLARRRKRLQMFFDKHDPARLIQIELLMTRDARGEDELMADLRRQYGVSDDGDGVGINPNAVRAEVDNSLREVEGGSSRVVGFLSTKTMATRGRSSDSSDIFPQTGVRERNVAPVSEPSLSPIRDLLGGVNNFSHSNNNSSSVGKREATTESQRILGAEARRSHEGDFFEANRSRYNWK